MANKAQVKVLKEGAATWNKWRMQNPETWPDLHGARLSGADLSRAYLSGVNLSAADLSFEE